MTNDKKMGIVLFGWIIGFFVLMHFLGLWGESIERFSIEGLLFIVYITVGLCINAIFVYTWAKTTKK